MKQVLPILIERAREARDQLSAAARAATLSVQQGEATLQQLATFRADYLLRSPTATVGGFSADRLHDWQRFMTRLDEAVAMQHEDCERRRQLESMRLQQLSDGQRRLMAFEALAARQALERDRRQARQAQRDSDEFAARAIRIQSLKE